MPKGFHDDASQGPAQTLIAAKNYQYWLQNGVIDQKGESER
jgi:hypothetical protein